MLRNIQIEARGFVSYKKRVLRVLSPDCNNLCAHSCKYKSFLLAIHSLINRPDNKIETGLTKVAEYSCNPFATKTHIVTSSR